MDGAEDAMSTKMIRTRFTVLMSSLLALGMTLAPESASAQVVTVEYIHTDALGSPVATTNQSGGLIERTVYEPYGRVVGGQAQDGPGYTGHVLDAATGLNYMQQRYYDPSIGRFLSVDPVTPEGDTGDNFNRYWYANNNPSKFIDPDGRKTSVMVNNNTPVTGTHSGWIIERDGNTTIYDPGGDFHHDTRGSGALLENEATLGDYIKFQMADGKEVYLFEFETTADQEAQIVQNAMEAGDPGPGFCAAGVTGTLSGVGAFKNLQGNLWPKSLLKQLVEIKANENKQQGGGQESQGRGQEQGQGQGLNVRPDPLSDEEDERFSL